MNIIQDRFLVRQLRDNSVYAILFIAILASFVVSIAIFTNKKIDNENKKAMLEKDIKELRIKSDFIAYQDTIENEGIDIDNMNILMSALVPETEDYFSIILALENLSKKSGFIIQEYTLNISQSTKEKLSITIEGTGDQVAFLSFLRDYTYGGGRLITVDKIDYLSQGFFQIKLAVNFYSGKGTLVSPSTINLTEADRELLTNIQQKVTIDILPGQDVAENTTYDTKTNPF